MKVLELLTEMVRKADVYQRINANQISPLEKEYIDKINQLLNDTQILYVSKGMTSSVDSKSLLERINSQIDYIKRLIGKLGHKATPILKRVVAENKAHNSVKNAVINKFRDALFRAQQD